MGESDVSLCGQQRPTNECRLEMKRKTKKADKYINTRKKIRNDVQCQIRWKE